MLALGVNWKSKLQNLPSTKENNRPLTNCEMVLVLGLIIYRFQVLRKIWEREREGDRENCEYKNACPMV